MKKIYIILLLIAFQFSAFSAEKYIVLGWNDLGMHCANKDFSLFAILPPANNFMAQVIKVGDKNHSPELISSGVTVEYSIPGNTYSVGKTNFWTYVEKLFGVKLADNIGLKGYGLSGTMTYSTDHYIAEAIPVTPYTDANQTSESPYQNCRLVVKNGSDVVATTMNTIPVSNEISCASSGCHKSEQNIINSHENEGGYDPTKTPILCASCHGSNALGLPGHSSMKSLSFRIHDKHKKVTDCYKCHPGSNAKCFRDVMFAAGKKCIDCHGTVANVASTIEAGRRPWLDEPKCGDTKCHGATYAEETGKLFRESKGHHGVYCSACHGSPHAIVPTGEINDNFQNKSLQGKEGKLKKCTVCHGFIPTGHGPHGITADIPSVPQLTAPANNATAIPINGTMTWQAGQNSDSYQIEISQSSDMASSTIQVSDLTNLNFILTSNTKYYWRVRGNNEFGWGDWSEIWSFTTGEPSSVSDEFISSLRIIPNYNFSSLVIVFESKALSLTDIKILDLRGLVVRELLNMKAASGIFSEKLDISDLNNGVYFIIIRKENSSKIEKLVIHR